MAVCARRASLKITFDASVFCGPRPWLETYPQLLLNPSPGGATRQLHIAHSCRDCPLFSQSALQNAPARPDENAIIEFVARPPGQGYPFALPKASAHSQDDHQQVDSSQ